MDINYNNNININISSGSNKNMLKFILFHASADLNAKKTRCSRCNTNTNTMPWKEQSETKRIVNQPLSHALHFIRLVFTSKIMLVKRKLFKEPTFFCFSCMYTKKLWILKSVLNVIQVENGKLFPFSLFNIVNVWSFIHWDYQQSIHICTMPFNYWFPTFWTTFWSTWNLANPVSSAVIINRWFQLNILNILR